MFARHPVIISARRRGRSKGDSCTLFFAKRWGGHALVFARPLTPLFGPMASCARTVSGVTGEGISFAFRAQKSEIGHLGGVRACDLSSAICMVTHHMCRQMFACPLPLYPPLPGCDVSNPPRPPPTARPCRRPSFKPLLYYRRHRHSCGGGVRHSHAFANENSIQYVH